MKTKLIYEIEEISSRNYEEFYHRFDNGVNVVKKQKKPSNGKIKFVDILDSKMK